MLWSFASAHTVSHLSDRHVESAGIEILCLNDVDWCSPIIMFLPKPKRRAGPQAATNPARRQLSKTTLEYLQFGGPRTAWLYPQNDLTCIRIARLLTERPGQTGLGISPPAAL